VFFEAPVLLFAPAAGRDVAAVIDVRAGHLHAPGQPERASQGVVISPGDARDFFTLLLAANGRREVGVQAPGSPSANPLDVPADSVGAGATDANGSMMRDSAPATKRAVSSDDDTEARIAAEAVVNVNDPFQEETTV